MRVDSPTRAERHEYKPPLSFPPLKGKKETHSRTQEEKGENKQRGERKILIVGMGIQET